MWSAVLVVREMFWGFKNSLPVRHRAMSRVFTSPKFGYFEY